MERSAISMVMFNSYVESPEGTPDFGAFGISSYRLVICYTLIFKIAIERVDLPI